MGRKRVWPLPTKCQQRALGSMPLRGDCSFACERPGRGRQKYRRALLRIQCFLLRPANDNTKNGIHFQKLPDQYGSIQFLFFSHFKKFIILLLYTYNITFVGGGGGRICVVVVWCFDAVVDVDDVKFEKNAPSFF